MKFKRYMMVLAAMIVAIVVLGLLVFNPAQKGRQLSWSWQGWRYPRFVLKEKVFYIADTNQFEEIYFYRQIGPFRVMRGPIVLDDTPNQ